MNYLSMGLSALALAVSMTVGYKWGSWRLESCRNDLAAIEKKGLEAQTLAKDAQRQLDDKQAALEKTSQAKIDGIVRGFDAERAELNTQLNQAGARLKASQGKSAGVESDLARVRAQIKLASTSTNASLQQQLGNEERALLATQGQLQQQQTGLACLQAAVPADEVALLNRNLSVAATAGTRP